MDRHCICGKFIIFCINNAKKLFSVLLSTTMYTGEQMKMAKDFISYLKTKKVHVVKSKGEVAEPYR